MHPNSVLSAAASSTVLALHAESASTGTTHLQGGTLTVPMIRGTLAKEFNLFSIAQKERVRGTMFDWYLEEAYIVREHIWKDVDDKHTFNNSDPVGSGPITEMTAVHDNQVSSCHAELHRDTAYLGRRRHRRSPRRQDVRRPTLLATADVPVRIERALSSGERAIGLDHHDSRQRRPASRKLCHRRLDATYPSLENEQ